MYDWSSAGEVVSGRAGRCTEEETIANKGCQWVRGYAEVKMGEVRGGAVKEEFVKGVDCWCGGVGVRS